MKFVLHQRLNNVQRHMQGRHQWMFVLHQKRSNVQRHTRGRLQLMFVLHQKWSNAQQCKKYSQHLKVDQFDQTIYPLCTCYYIQQQMKFVLHQRLNNVQRHTLGTPQLMSGLVQLLNTAQQCKKYSPHQM